MSRELTPEARAALANNVRVIEQIKGVPAQPGTPETDADPHNPSRPQSVLGAGHCDTCRWWGRERAHDDDRPYGTCRGTPPQPGQTIALAYHDPGRPSVAGPMIRRGEWLWTAFDDRCVMHQCAAKSLLAP